MLTLDEIRKKKEEYCYTNEQLSKVSGVPLGTIQKVLGNVTKSPRYETLKALSAVFEEKEVPMRIKYETYEQVDDPTYLREEPMYQISAPPVAVNWNEYARQGTYTMEDYLALPDDQRVELIDGVIYDMGAPTTPHQMIGGLLFRRIAEHIEKNKGQCIPFMSPVDVQLDMDNKTIVQPDVLIVCDRSKINRARVFGAPDFVAEVLSPSTKAKDILVKTHKYAEAGVREYWIIDPMKQTVTVYDFEGGLDIEYYSFDDEIPMALYDGKLVIDFKEIKEYISFIADPDQEDEGSGKKTGSRKQTTGKKENKAK